MEKIPIFFLGFIVTILCIVILQPIARKIGLVDKPGGRKKHQGVIPLVGGLAMYIGLLTILFVINEPIGPFIGLLSGATLLLIVGLLDDIYMLTAFTRFLAQITAALLMIFLGNVYLYEVGSLFGSPPIALGFWAVPVTIFATVGVINAFNMADGMDGLAGGFSLIILTCLGIIAAISDGGKLVYIFPALIAVITAFQVFNIRTPWRNQAQIFMGNSGSMCLGFILAWLFIYYTQTEHRLVSPILALWLFALPLLDTVCIMIRRIIKGRSPFQSDREHFHHILLLAGYSVSQSVWIMLTIAALLAGIGITGFYFGLPESLMFFTFMLLFFLYFWGMTHAWKVMKVIKRDKNTKGNQRDTQPIIRSIKSSEK